MNNCHQCETALIEGQLVCPSCGAENPETTQAEPASVEEVSEPVARQETIAAPAKPPAPKPKSTAGSNRGMTTSTKAWIAIFVAVAFAAGLIFWQIKAKHNRILILTTLTAEDMKLIAADLPPETRQQLAKYPEARKDYAGQLKQYLALAAEARAAGFADKPETKEQLELMRSVIVAELYEMKQAEARGPSPAFADVKVEDVKAFMAERGQEDKFKLFVEARKRESPGGKDLPEEQLKELKDQWAKVMITERKAEKAGFDQLRNVQLQIATQQARVLGLKYAKEVLQPQLQATDAEIDAYIAAHPELDENKLRATADDVLKRVRAGEDFAALAKQYSSDPGNKDNGGELPWFGRNQMAKEFEEAAFKLQPGQVSDVVKTRYGYHIIKLDGRRKEKGPDGKEEEQVHARHILISMGVNSNDRKGPAPSGRDVARNAVEKDKGEKLMADITKRNNITVAEDFEVEAPPVPRHPQMPGMPPDAEMQQGPPPGASREQIVPVEPSTSKGAKAKPPAPKSRGR